MGWIYGAFGGVTLLKPPGVPSVLGLGRPTGCFRWVALPGPPGSVTHARITPRNSSGNRVPDLLGRLMWALTSAGPIRWGRWRVLRPLAPNKPLPVESPAIGLPRLGFRREAPTEEQPVV